MTQKDVPKLVSEGDRTRRRLYALLRSKDERALWKRPPSGDWSVAEVVRHLVFAEQKHLGDFLPDGLAWNPMKLRQRSKTVAVKGGTVAFRLQERQLIADFGAKPKQDLEEVLRAWDIIHDPIRKALRANHTAAIQHELERHLGHLQAHVAAIEQQLAPKNS
jgi:DinB superfamily